MRRINLVVAVSYGFVCYVEVGFGGCVAVRCVWVGSATFGQVTARRFRSGCVWHGKSRRGLVRLVKAV